MERERERKQSRFLQPPTTTFHLVLKCFQLPLSFRLRGESLYLHSLHTRAKMWQPSSRLKSRDTAIDPFWSTLPPSDPQFHAAYSQTGGPCCRGGMTSYSNTTFSSESLSNANIPHPFYLFHSQEALTVFKEAMQKMPRQFAPQSLYNMMGKSCFCFISSVYTP